jgi:NAD(P) transhydrogenase
MKKVDVIIIGCGPAGERAAIQAAKAGKHAVVVERSHVVGGTRVNWGTIPSKTLRESALFVYQLTRGKIHGIRTEIPDGITVADFMFRERIVVQRELELINESLGRYHIEVVRGHGRFLDLHTVAVEGADRESPETFSADVIVIATGSSPNRPPDVPFDGRYVFDSDTILQLPRIPQSMIVLGAGVVGIEYASIFAALGIGVTLVDTRDRLLPYLDREIVGIVKDELEKLNMTILHSDRYAAIERAGGPHRRVRCRLRKGGTLEADVLLYCVGRDGNTRDIGLEEIGIEPDAYGLIEVNEHYQTLHSHIYAVGDVIGYPALASTSMEQGRQVIRHAFGIPGPTGRIGILPFAVYAIPEVSYIGETEETLRERGIDYIPGHGRYSMNPRGQIIGETGGLLKLLFDAKTLRLLGVHIVGQGASELIHTGQAFLYEGTTAAEIAETIYNYPTLSDLYRHAALSALHEVRRREEGRA